MLITKSSRLLQIIAFYDFFTSFPSFPANWFRSSRKWRLSPESQVHDLFTSLLRIWDRIDLVITVNTSSQSQWNAA